MSDHFTRSSLLDTLALKYGTDKGSCDHDYMPYYTQYLEPLRDRPITLLELGVWHGASLRMWRAYFPKATIVGMDNADRGVQIPDVHIVQGNQDSPSAAAELAEMYGQFDVIIDDASHISSKTIASFKYLYPHLKDGGLYVIEDLQTSYDPVNYTHFEASVHPLLFPLRRHDEDRAQPTAMQFCTQLAHEVNAGLYPEEYRLGYSISSVQFFPNICFIVKGETWTTS